MAGEEVADIKKSYQWLDQAGLKDSTEALIMALSTWSLKAASTIAGKTPDGGSATLSLCLHLSHINGEWSDCHVALFYSPSALKVL